MMIALVIPGRAKREPGISRLQASVHDQLWISGCGNDGFMKSHAALMHRVGFVRLDRAGKEPLLGSAKVQKFARRTRGENGANF